MDVFTIGPFITVVFKPKREDPLDDKLSVLQQALNEAGITLGKLSARLIAAPENSAMSVHGACPQGIVGDYALKLAHC